MDMSYFSVENQKEEIDILSVNTHRILHFPCCSFICSRIVLSPKNIKKEGIWIPSFYILQVTRHFLCPGR